MIKNVGVLMWLCLSCWERWPLDWADQAEDPGPPCPWCGGETDIRYVADGR